MPLPCIRLPYDTARDHAARHGWREKVLAYVTRRPDELLVFAHDEHHPGAGIQVPGGGVDPTEQPADAVVRETWEESGLRLADPVHLGSFEWQVEAPSRIRHCYWLQAPISTADHLEHLVTAGEQDQGMIFHYAFAPRSRPGLLLGHGFESGLNDLDRMINSRS
ncbi:MAG: NUDIX domain-containing protein [Microlunatus sp.]|nr:NUDIX domain-containing protein [Microlunatus sp.]